MRYCQKQAALGVGLAVVVVFVFVYSTGMLTNNPFVEGQLKLQGYPTPMGHRNDGVGGQETERTKLRSLPPVKFTPEDSPPNENKEMAFMRKHGRLHGLPSEEEIKQLTDKQVHYIYHSYLDNTEYLCHRKLRMGNVGDGGWEVCDDFQFRPIRPCVVYSFGIRYDFTFDDDVGKLYGCDVHSFDPSMKNNSYRRSDRVYFHKIGLSDAKRTLPGHVKALAEKDQWRLETLTNIKAMLNHQNTTIDILKMDIEHSEWAAMIDIIANRELTHVRQLLMEYHLYNTHTGTVRQRMPVLSKIEALGFRRFYTHMNPMCGKLDRVFPVKRTTCYEVYYVNTRFVRTP